MFLDCNLTNGAVQERDLNKMAFVFEIWESTTDVFFISDGGYLQAQLHILRGKNTVNELSNSCFL